MDQYKTQPGAMIIGASLVVATLIGGMFYLSGKRSGDVLSVTGSAKTSVTSDTAKITFMITRDVTTATTADGYRAMGKDLDAVKQFLIAKGVTAEHMTISPVTMEQNYDYNNTGAPKTYTLRQTVATSDTDIARITSLSKEVQTLINSGAAVSIQSLDYLYSKLPELRQTLLGDAVKDAMVRAESIAEASGQHVGSLRSAAGGVVQVLAPESVDVSDYGTYDTSSIEKNVTITVRTTFSLR